MGRAHLLAEEWNDAGAALERVLALTRERRTGLASEGMILACLAGARLGVGDLAGARQWAEEAVAACRSHGTRLYELPALLARARVGIAQGGASPEVERDLAEALAGITATGAERYRPLIHLERAYLARRRGDAAAREHELREAERLFRAMGAMAQAAAELAG